MGKECKCFIVLELRWVTFRLTDGRMPSSEYALHHASRPIRDCATERKSANAIVTPITPNRVLITQQYRAA